MPQQFRTRDGKHWKASHTLQLTLANGTQVEGLWGGSAQVEKLDWWLRKPAHDLAQTEEVAEVGVKDDDTQELRWGAAPRGARIFFVLQEPAVSKEGKPYRLAKMVTTAATEGQKAYFNDDRFSLFGTFHADGTIAKIAPLPVPSPSRPAQGELFL